MGVCELNLLETSCNVASVGWLPAQHTKHLNALCPLDLACPPLECELCVCVCVFFAYDTSTLESVCCQQGRGSKSVSPELESPAATSSTRPETRTGFPF